MRRAQTLASEATGRQAKIKQAEKTKTERMEKRDQEEGQRPGARRERLRQTADEALAEHVYTALCIDNPGCYPPGYMAFYLLVHGGAAGRFDSPTE
ncbi:hypothetical protein [Nocardia lijiangensis]|uniref:hypothetical protein n=1 Tax=Nocardia lijiangensis TaxID=299618 RepID=UPI003D72ADEC